MAPAATSPWPCVLSLTAVQPGLAPAMMGAAGVRVLVAFANRLARVPWAASAALALPELATLLAAKHLALAGLG